MFKVLMLAAAVQPTAAPPAAAACQGGSVIPSVFAPDLATLQTAPGVVRKGGRLLAVRLRHRELGRLSRTASAGWISMPAGALMYRSDFDMRQRLTPITLLPFGITVGQTTPAPTWCGMGQQHFAWGPPKPRPLCLVLGEEGPTLHLANSPFYNETINGTPYAVSAKDANVEVRPEPTAALGEVQWRLEFRGVNRRSGELSTRWTIHEGATELARGFPQVGLDGRNAVLVPPFGASIRVDRAAQTATVGLAADCRPGLG